MEYVMSSTARLTSQLKSVQGWADVTFLSANLQIPLSSNLESVRCSVVTNKQGATITRNSSACKYSEHVNWNESVAFPCCLDWDLELSVHAKSNRSQEVVAVSEVMLLQSIGTVSLPLRVGAKCVGELEVSIVFHPNYRSFKYLTIGCYLSEQLSYSLTSSILHDLKSTSQLMEEKMHAIISEEDIVSVISTVDHFTIFLTEEETYHGELCAALNIQLPREQAPPAEEATSHRYNALLRPRSVKPPQLVPIHRVASGAKSFLSKLLGDLPQPPPVTIELVEKLLNIHTQALFVPTVRRSSSKGDAEMSLTWNQFAQFCVTAALWFLQQAVTAHQLLAQCNNLTLAELDALRFGFSQYDTELAGLIQASDLHSLLQDMGEDYTEAEVGMTVCYLDPDGLGTLSLADFVRWWCE